jgi:hypothetical protein
MHARLIFKNLLYWGHFQMVGDFQTNGVNLWKPLMPNDPNVLPNDPNV